MLYNQYSICKRFQKLSFKLNQVNVTELSMSNHEKPYSYCYLCIITKHGEISKLGKRDPVSSL